MCEMDSRETGTFFEIERERERENSITCIRYLTYPRYASPYPSIYQVMLHPGAPSDRTPPTVEHFSSRSRVHFAIGFLLRERHFKKLAH